MMFTLALGAIVIDGFRNNLDNSSVPTEEMMNNGLKDVEGFIIPVQSVSDVKQWMQLASTTGRKVYGFRIVPKKGKDPRVSVQQAIGFLKSKDFLGKNTTVFIDARHVMFGDDCKKNQRFVVEMYDELQMHLGGPKRIGVMTKKGLWTEKMCNMKWDNVKLWYVNHNKKPTFGDFTIFGGWMNPIAKQYDQVTFQGKEGDNDVDYTYALDYFNDEPA